MKKFEYGKWIRSLVYDFYKNNRGDEENGLNDFLEENCFFVTMKFKKSLMDDLKQKYDLHGLLHYGYEIEFDDFHRLYIYLQRRLLGRHYKHKADEAALAIAAIDFEGSRYASSTSLSNADPHIHAILVLRPEDVEKFRRLIDGPRFRLQFLDSLHGKVTIDPFDRNKGSIEKLSSYAAKSNEKTKLAGTSDLIRIYPQCNYNQNGITYRTAFHYKKYSKSLEKMISYTYRD